MKPSDCQSVPVATLAYTDWNSLTLGDRIRHLEVEGYLVLPGMLSPDQVARVSPRVRAVLGDRNTRIWNYDGANVTDDLKSEASGINPSRWDLT